MTGIYKITNIKTGMFYIGRSKHIERRWEQHFEKGYGAIHSGKFQHDIDVYGKEGFKFEVLEECDEELLDERERFYISKLKPEYNTVYEGHSVSPETRSKISKSLTGKKQSAETKEKRIKSILKRHKTFPQTNEKHKKKVGCEEISEPFGSVKECAEYFGVHPSTVTKALKNNHKVKGHKVWYVV